jgi:hypothetical protein
MSSLEQNLSTLALMNITECLKRRKTCDRTCDEDTHIGGPVLKIRSQSPASVIMST